MDDVRLMRADKITPSTMRCMGAQGARFHETDLPAHIPAEIVSQSRRDSCLNATPKKKSQLPIVR
jgi:hypothetical protein